jgi:hypothetical protein
VASLTRLTNNSSSDYQPSWSCNIIPGDANGDGKLNAVDITLVEMIVAGLAPVTPGSDADLDGAFNSVDITRTERLVAGLN